MHHVVSPDTLHTRTRITPLSHLSLFPYSLMFVYHTAEPASACSAPPCGLMSEELFDAPRATSAAASAKAKETNPISNEATHSTLEGTLRASLHGGARIV